MLSLTLSSVSEAVPTDDDTITHWLAFLETSDWNQNPKSCHAVVIHPNWALSTNDCVPKLPPEQPDQEIMLRFSEGSNHNYDQVKVIEVIRPSTEHTSYPVLLKLESELKPPFAPLSFKTQAWFDALENRYPLWKVFYMNRLKQSGHFLLSRPKIDILFNPVKIKDQSDCHPFIRGIDWKICSIPADSRMVLSRDFQRGSVLLDQGFSVTGLGYVQNPENTTMGVIYFTPMTPFRTFINRHTGTNHQIDRKYKNSNSEL
ncbi:hypothetical protein [Endozoicomonas montiporae]|uniref:hypothetical protein n=1 Tax=Endozoicomonas montiporae TaxID=1027273 RepID=UPI001C9DA8B2|nr:hypothetical protein [Endozoicomonas montiporae]